MSNDNNSNYALPDAFNVDDKTLFNIYISEYNDIYSHIGLLPSCEFLQNVIKRVELTLIKKFNGFSYANSKAKVEMFFIENVYTKEYKLAMTILRSLKKKTSPHIFEGNITEHCKNETKVNGLYVHSCGEHFHMFKYNNNGYDGNNLYLVCLKCEMIYKQNLVKFYCNKCKSDFYSTVSINNNNNSNSSCSSNSSKNIKLPYATWKKYHCNAIINETLKCLDCRSNLLFDEMNYMLICTKCDKNINPNNIMWKCIVCQNEFNTEIKVYNPLEFKNMKISVKDTLLSKIKAKPDRIICGCVDIDIQNTKYYHKVSCKGELYLGEMNRKKIIVCSKCEALSFYDNFTWTCPMCYKKFKLGGSNTSSKCCSSGRVNVHVHASCISSSAISNNNNNNNNNSGKIIRCDSASRSKNRKGMYTPSSEQKENQSFFANCNFKKGRNMIPTPSKNLSKSGMKKVNGIKSPYMMLKQNLAEKFTRLEIDDSIRNLGNVFALTEANDNIIERLISENNNKKSNSSSCSKNNSNMNSYKTIEYNDTNTKTNNKDKSTTIDNTSKVFDINDFVIKKQIGEGSFGKIYLVESIKTNKHYAMKKIVATTTQELQTLKHEYEILLSLQKPTNPKLNLVLIHGIQTKQLDQTTYVMYVLMDLANTDWEKEILTRQKTRNYYSEVELFTHLKSLISTFAELQRKNISHRDIKPQNILVFYDDNKYKIADFGEAKVLFGNNGNTNKQTLRGTELYMSPVLFHALRKKCGVGSVEHNTYKSDVYSFGYCALFAASLCYEALYDIRELMSMGNVRNVVERYIGKRYSGKFIDLIMGMLEVNEKMRGDFIELERVFENAHY